MKKLVLLWWKTSLLAFQGGLFASIWRMIPLIEHGILRNSKWTSQAHPYLSELIYHLLLHQVPCLKECEPWGIDEIDGLINAAIFLNRALRCRVSHFINSKYINLPLLTIMKRCLNRYTFSYCKSTFFLIRSYAYPYLFYRYFCRTIRWLPSFCWIFIKFSYQFVRPFILFPIFLTKFHSLHRSIHLISSSAFAKFPFWEFWPQISMLLPLLLVLS